MPHASLWILTFATLFKPFFISQTRGKFLIYLQESGGLLLTLRGPSFLPVPPASTADPETCPQALATCLQGAAGSSSHAATALRLPASTHLSIPAQGCPSSGILHANSFPAFALEVPLLLVISSTQWFGRLWKTPKGLFCWVKAVSFTFSKDPVRFSGKASWEVKLKCIYLKTMHGNPSTQIQICTVIFIVDASTGCLWYAKKTPTKYPVNWNALVVMAVIAKEANLMNK